LIAILALAGGLGSSLYWTQVVKGATYAAKADKQYDKPQVSLFDRGSIYFEAKDGTKAAAATVSTGYLLHMNPKVITDPEAVYEALTHYIKLDKKEFMRKAALKNDPYEELEHRVDKETMESIKALSLQGIAFAKESWRSYPGGELSAHSLGLIGENQDGVVEGRYGLERTYESVLARQGTESSSNMFADLFGDIKESVFGDEEEKSGSVITTIEPTVEKYLEQILKETSATWKPDEIGAIVIDPQTGKIVAMAVLPSYDPNNISKVKNPKLFSNPLVENVYEMGSIIKPLTVAVGLDTGVITPKSTYDDTGTMTLNTKKISNYDGKAR
jgi:cell division protein FtsI/penicillin-binding protein 2